MDPQVGIFLSPLNTHDGFYFFSSRENELLKHQLRKYVNAVQMLRTEGAQKEGECIIIGTLICSHSF